MMYLCFRLQLENSRLSAAKNSPMMEGIESCIDYIDEQVITDLTPKLLNIIRKGVGLPTKVFVINLISSLFWDLMIYRLIK